MSLKAELEALRGNYRRAGKLLGNRTVEAEPLQGLEEVQVLCNMAYIQHQERKYHTAVLCYSKALQLASTHKAVLLPWVRTASMVFKKLCKDSRCRFWRASIHASKMMNEVLIFMGLGILATTAASERLQEKLSLYLPALQVEGEDVKASAANISNPAVAILYSCGMQALLMKQYNFAHECFQVRQLFQNPEFSLKLHTLPMLMHLLEALRHSRIL